MNQATIGVGLIGCGLIGTKRSQALPPSCELRAVFDSNARASRDFASKHPTPVRQCSTIDELLNLDDVRVVIIATSHDALASLAVRAVEAGRDVFVEKPGGRTTNELISIKRARDLAKVHVQVGFNHRFHPAILRARELIEHGGYGGLLWVRGRYGHGGRIGYEKEWRADRARSGGGELLDQGCHLLDLTRFLFGELSLEYAKCMTAFWPMKVEDNAFLALKPEAGGFAWLHVSWTEWKNLFSIEITLARAKIEIQGLGGSYGTETLTLHEMSPEMGPPRSTKEQWESKSDESWGRELEDFIHRLTNPSSLGASVEDAIAVHQLIEEAYAQ